MVDVGDTAPDFEAPLADGDISTVSLAEALEEAPVVLAFFPGAFTGGCIDEMCAIRDSMSGFDDIGATVYGVSRDSPVTLNEFRDQYGLNFGLVSDMDGTIIQAYGIAKDIPPLGLTGVADRSVFVLDSEGTVTYTWFSEGPGSQPDFEAVQAAAAETS